VNDHVRQVAHDPQILGRQIVLARNRDSRGYGVFCRSHSISSSSLIP
jgi:hypothetical protein